jgi:hypothetical protein
MYESMRTPQDESRCAVFLFCVCLVVSWSRCLSSYRRAAPAIPSFTSWCCLVDLHIVDTTGAGDASIGEVSLWLIKYSKYSARKKREPARVQFALEFGSWVGGRKLLGPGARRELPKVPTLTKYSEQTIDIKSTLKETLSPLTITVELLEIPSLLLYV